MPSARPPTAAIARRSIAPRIRCRAASPSSAPIRSRAPAPSSSRPRAPDRSTTSTSDRRGDRSRHRSHPKGARRLERSGVAAIGASSSAAARPSPRCRLGRKRVLVIDDDDGIRRITQMLVEGLGHEVEAARDGIEGLAKLQLGVDLVLLDVVMPGLDGFDVCRRIRQDPDRQRRARHHRDDARDARASAARGRSRRERLHREAGRRDRAPRARRRRC